MSSELKKIVILAGSYFGQTSGGSEYQLKLLGEYLLDQNFDVHYIFRDRGTPIRKIPEFKLHSYAENKIFSSLFGTTFFPYLLQIIILLSRLKPDVIIARPAAAYVGIAAIYCSCTKTKLIWHISHRKDVSGFKWNSYSLSSLLRYIEYLFICFGIKKADRIVGQAKYQCELLKKNFDRDCNSIIPNFHLNSEKQIDKRRPYKVLWVANNKSFKQPEKFIELAKIVKNDGVRFIMAGRNITPEHFADSYIPSNLQMLGELPIEEVNLLMAQSHIFVNTSIAEGFANTFIQAWLNKMLLVTLNIDPDNLLKENDIGICAKSVEEISSYIKSFIKYPDKYHDICAKGRRYALENHSIKELKQYKRLITSL